MITFLTRDQTSNTPHIFTGKRQQQSTSPPSEFLTNSSPSWAQKQPSPIKTTHSSPPLSLGHRLLIEEHTLRYFPNRNPTAAGESKHISNSSCSSHPRFFPCLKLTCPDSVNQKSKLATKTQDSVNAADQHAKLLCRFPDKISQVLSELF